MNTTTQISHDTMQSIADIPPQSPVSRAELSELYIRGNGIEIGALHNPLPVSTNASVQYVDRHTIADLRLQYPDLASYALTPVDIIDDGETLQSIADSSQDFVIASHFLEHCEDPICAMQNFFRVLRNDGILFLVIPDKRYTFDRDRPVTALQHLIDDHRNGPSLSREAHYREWVRLVDKSSGQAGEDALYKERTNANFSIHFHVWTDKEIRELMRYLQHTISFVIEEFIQNGFEWIVIVRKTS